MWTTIEQLAPYAVAYTIPLLIVALGGLYSERSGVSNLALEGLMVIGSFAAAMTIHFLPLELGSQAIWLGLLAACIAGGLFALLHALACVTLNANQIISGIAINMLAAALSIFIARIFVGSGTILVETLVRNDLPILSKLPLVGKMFFSSSYATTWLVVAICVLAYLLLYKTAFGLRLRACGENPYAADAAGIDVTKIRYLAVIISGMLSGLGGAIILVTYSGEFSGSVFGQGFLAIVAMIFGRWSIRGIVLASSFFGISMTIANVSQVVPALMGLPTVLFKTFPYVITLVALIFFSKNTRAPKALGEAFWRGKR